MKRAAMIFLAVLFCGTVLFVRSSQGKDDVVPESNPDGSLNLAVWERSYTPQAGDVIRCVDGSNYTIASVDGYEVFSADVFLLTDMPEITANHVADVSGDYLFLRNLSATSQMVSSLSDYLGVSPDIIQPYLPEDNDSSASLTWDVERAAAIPGKGGYGAEAWDIFKNGVYLWTSYQVGRV